MTLMVCLDDRNGLMFNIRRQSRDSAVIADAVAFAAPEKISVCPYTAPLFPEHTVIVSEEPFLNAAFCFAECGDFGAVKNKVDRLVIYRWNRSYPGDVYFPVEEYLNGMTLQESVDFPGSSHERITREVYVV